MSLGKEMKIRKHGRCDFGAIFEMKLFLRAVGATKPTFISLPNNEMT